MEREYRSDWLSAFTNASFIARRGLLKAVASLARDAGDTAGRTWVDVGCGIRPYEALFPGAKYVGVDVEQSGRPTEIKRPDIYYDGLTIPLPDASADGVLCTQVLEHVPEPAALVREIARLLKPGGILIATFPFAWAQHEKPYDFHRFSEFAAARLVETAGLRLVRHEKCGGPLETLGQLAAGYVAQELIARLPKGRGLAVAALCGPLQLAAVGLQAVLPNSGDLYLDNALLACKPS